MVLQDDLSDSDLHHDLIQPNKEVELKQIDNLIRLLKLGYACNHVFNHIFAFLLKYK